jgi:hypothetical protein
MLKDWSADQSMMRKNKKSFVNSTGRAGTAVADDDKH